VCGRRASAASSMNRCTRPSALKDLAFQSLYHFTVGGPVDDPRLTTLRPTACTWKGRSADGPAVDAGAVTAVAGPVTALPGHPLLRRMQRVKSSRGRPHLGYSGKPSKSAPTMRSRPAQAKQVALRSARVPFGTTAKTRHPRTYFISSGRGRFRSSGYSRHLGRRGGARPLRDDRGA